MYKISNPYTCIVQNNHPYSIVTLLSYLPTLIIRLRDHSDTALGPELFAVFRSVIHEEPHDKVTTVTRRGQHTLSV